jgi:hypothetical protein
VHRRNVLAQILEQALQLALRQQQAHAHQRHHQHQRMLVHLRAPNLSSFYTFVYASIC